MRTLGKALVVFLAVTGAATLLIHFFGVEFGIENYWDHHGLLFLFFITFFPRLTLLFSSVPFGGFLWWMGFVFAPRILVAFLATIAYWHSNPILVIISWLVAFSGESGEKYMVRNRVRVIRTQRFGPGAGRGSTGSTGATATSSNQTGPVIDADYRRLD